MRSSALVFVGTILVGCAGGDRSGTHLPADTDDAHGPDAATDIVADEPGVAHTLDCLERWSGVHVEGTLSTSTGSGSPVFTVTAVDRDARSVAMTFDWHDAAERELVGAVRADGALTFTLPVPRDRSLPGDVVLEGRFGEACEVLLGVGVSGPETAVMTVARGLDGDAQAARLAASPRWLLAPRDEPAPESGDAWLVARPDPRGVALELPALGAHDVILDRQESGFSAYTMIAPIDGDPTRTALRVEVDGRSATFEIDGGPFAELVAEGSRADLEACLASRELAGYVPVGGRAIAITARLEAGGLRLTDANGQELVARRMDRTHGDWPSSVSFALEGTELSLVVAADCGVAWGFGFDGVKRREAWLR